MVVYYHYIVNTDNCKRESASPTQGQLPPRVGATLAVAHRPNGAQIPSPGGKVARPNEVRKSGSEEECGRKTESQYNITDLFLGWKSYLGVGLQVSCNRALPPAFLSRPLRGHPLPGRGNFPAASAAGTKNFSPTPVSFFSRKPSYRVEGNSRARHTVTPRGPPFQTKVDQQKKKSEHENLIICNMHIIPEKEKSK